MLETLILATMYELLHPRVQARGYLREPVEEARARYAAIADDIAAVASEPDEAPLFDGPGGREATALLLASIAWHESAFRKDVDACEGIRARGDHGRSIGLLQVMAGPNHEGHDPQEICRDRRLAIRLGLHVLRRARATCGGAPRAWLQSYAAGGCSIRSNAARDVCEAFEKVGKKRLTGISCDAAGPVGLRTPSAGAGS